MLQQIKGLLFPTLSPFPNTSYMTSSFCFFLCWPHLQYHFSTLIRNYIAVTCIALSTTHNVYVGRAHTYTVRGHLIWMNVEHSPIKAILELNTTKKEAKGQHFVHAIVKASIGYHICARSVTLENSNGSVTLENSNGPSCQNAPTDNAENLLCRLASHI